jgi:DNA/RNA endonuclease YhcR with UshA esterase domain
MIKQFTNKMPLPVDGGNITYHAPNPVKGEIMPQVQYPLKFLSVALLPLVFAVTGLAYTAPSSARDFSVSQVRSLPVGTAVTVAGSVSTPSGVFESSFFDKGFGLQDRSAGIYVSLQTDLGVKPNRQVRVSGILQDSFGLLILVPATPSDVAILRGNGPVVKPQFFSTGAIGEATEGRLVQVVGTISQAPTNDLPFGFKFFVNDGSGELQIFVNVQTGIDVGKLKLGQRASITGFSSQFDTHYEIDPRGPSDIVVQKR